jgi:hypothetical protein
MSYEPIQADELETLRDAMRTGLSMQQCRRLISELERAERERQRMQEEIENVRAGRQAMRGALLMELQETRAQLASAPKPPEVGVSEVEVKEIDSAGIQEMRMATRVAKDGGFKVVLVNADVMMSILNEIVEQRAWIRVAAESNGAVGAYLRKIDPSLEEPYGMPVDGVRRVVEKLQQEIDKIREESGG